jgi:hypothetical protein
VNVRLCDWWGMLLGDYLQMIWWEQVNLVLNRVYTVCYVILCRVINIKYLDLIEAFRRNLMFKMFGIILQATKSIL